MNEDIFKRLYSIICDSHVHIGKWEDGYYFSPQDIFNKLKKLGIQKWAVSSTSTIDNDFTVVKAEFEKLLTLAPDKTIPLLWITPEMIDESKDLSKYNGIPFYGLKVHGFANNWDLKGDKIRVVMDVARKRELPILIHTGWTSESEAGNYADICREFNDVTIILAHGRPLDQTIKVMKGNNNVYVDTAYMPEDDIGEISHILGNDRILFGTDFPLDEYYYPQDSITVRYRKRVEKLVESFGENAFLTWANYNFHKIFKLQQQDS